MWDALPARPPPLIPSSLPPSHRCREGQARLGKAFLPAALPASPLQAAHLGLPPLLDAPPPPPRKSRGSPGLSPRLSPLRRRRLPGAAPRRSGSCPPCLPACCLPARRAAGARGGAARRCGGGGAAAPPPQRRAPPRPALRGNRPRLLPCVTHAPETPPSLQSLLLPLPRREWQPRTEVCSLKEGAFLPWDMSAGFSAPKWWLTLPGAAGAAHPLPTAPEKRRRCLGGTPLSRSQEVSTSSRDLTWVLWVCQAAPSRRCR